MTWFLVLDLLLTGWATVGESLYRSEPPLLRRKHEDPLIQF